MTSCTFGVLSDTHYSGNEEHFPVDELRLHFQEVDRILHAGDVGSEHALNILDSIAPVDAVAGNMDPYEVSRLLPEKKLLDCGGMRIGIVHGAVALPVEDKLRYYFGREKIDVFVFGHTHRPFNERIKGVLFFNPGSLMKPRDPGPPTIGILRLSEGKAEGSIIPVHL